jgi:hypothetical protein
LRDVEHAANHSLSTQIHPARYISLTYRATTQAEKPRMYLCLVGKQTFMLLQMCTVTISVLRTCAILVAVDSVFLSKMTNKLRAMSPTAIAPRSVASPFMCLQNNEGSLHDKCTFAGASNNWSVLRGTWSIVYAYIDSKK